MYQSEKLQNNIREGKVRIGVIGLGYVGLPVALTFSRKFNVVGYDSSMDLINALEKGHSHIIDISEDKLRKSLGSNFMLSLNESDLKSCDFFVICVPTPLDENKQPDLKYVEHACQTIKRIMKKGSFIILESTTYPGTTDEVVMPILEETGLKAGTDFGVAYSPERIDPGNKKFRFEDMPKIVGGVNKKCTKIAANLYRSIVNAKVIEVKDCKTAEAVKILENIFREVNIALINEMALIFEIMNIDTWEVVEAAATKPFGFMPFYPGPGVGGHCIPLDPLYLSYQAKKYGFIPRFIELSSEINEYMAKHTTYLLSKGLSEVGMEIKDSLVTVLGVAYKKDVNDARESPARKIIEEILELGAGVNIYDPYVPEIYTRRGCLKSAKDMKSAVENSDALVIITNHTQFTEINYQDLLKSMRHPIIVDCRNVIKKEPENSIYLGIGKPSKSKAKG